MEVLLDTSWSRAFGVGVLEEEESTAVMYSAVLALCRGMAVPFPCLQDKAHFTHQHAGGIWTRGCLLRTEAISLAPGDASGLPG